MQGSEVGVPWGVGRKRVQGGEAKSKRPQSRKCGWPARSKPPDGLWACRKELPTPHASNTICGRVWLENRSLSPHTEYCFEIAFSQEEEWEWKLKDKKKVTLGTSLPWSALFIINSKRQGPPPVWSPSSYRKDSPPWQAKPEQKASGVWGLMTLERTISH